MFCQNVLDEFVKNCREIMGEQLTGVYLHGSMAFGCFNPQKSDIDLIVVIEENLTDAQKMEFMSRVAELNKKAPAKGLEFSVVKRSVCRPFVYPTPFELHFSPAHLQWFLENPDDYIRNMKGEDRDLAAHFTVINSAGITLFGEEIRNVFGEVPGRDYADSIRRDVESAGEDILQEPIYVILNLCRTLAFLREGLCLSKEQGGQWMLARMEDMYGPRAADYSERREAGTAGQLIEQALACYRTERTMEIEPESAARFAEEMLAAVGAELERMVHKP